jgi:hypothetical protein
VRNDLQFRPRLAHVNNQVEYDVAAAHVFASRLSALTQCEAWNIELPLRFNPASNSRSAPHSQELMVRRVDADLWPHPAIGMVMTLISHYQQMTITGGSMSFMSAAARP